MAVHLVRKLARAITTSTRTGTPIRFARGVVVSATVGQTTLTIDGGATSIAAFNHDHYQSLPAGAVVDVLLVGREAYVLGSYGSVGQPVPTGVLLPWSPSATPPAGGWLLADGRAVLRATWAALNALYSAAGYPYGNGNGTTTFNLPDARGRQLVALLGGDPNFGTVGAAGGAATHALTLGAGFAEMTVTATTQYQNQVGATWTSNQKWSISGETAGSDGHITATQLGGSTDDGPTLDPFLVIGGAIVKT